MNSADCHYIAVTKFVELKLEIHISTSNLKINRQIKKSLSTFVHKIQPNKYRIVKNSANKYLRWNRNHEKERKKGVELKICCTTPIVTEWATCKIVFMKKVSFFQILISNQPFYTVVVWFLDMDCNFLEKSIECQSMHSLQINSHLLLHPRLQK